MQAKIAKKVEWDQADAIRIESEYQQLRASTSIPPVNQNLVDFMRTECDFSAEHADGSFLEHLLFCYDYSAIHFPDHSANVMLLHSILGTGTNTFAMEAAKLPDLRALLTPFEIQHVEAFPSFLRLLYQPAFLGELEQNISRLDQLESVSYHRVIDNERQSMAAEDFWIQLNYQLIHYVDFLPVANWETHFSDPLLQNFIDLVVFLEKSKKRLATVHLPIPSAGMFTSPVQEKLSFGSRLSTIIPVSIKKKQSTKAIQRFSERINHSLAFEFVWNG